MASPSQSDINTLIQNAACIACAIPEGEQMPVLISLIFQLAQSGVIVSGGLAYSEGAGDPVAPPTAPASPAVYRNTVDGVISWWDVTSQTWQ